MRAIPPVPIDRPDRAPAYLQSRGTANVDKWYPGRPNAAGMRPRPPGHHGGWDIFAPENTPVVAPFPGRTVNYRASVGTTGSVYGGVLGVESDQGPSVILRHITPLLSGGVRVNAGDLIARVSPWSGGATHVHMECYPRWPSPYEIAASVNPNTWEWTDRVEEPPAPDWYVEDMPHNRGGTGPVVVRVTPSLAVAKAAVVKQKALGRLVSTIRDRRDERFYVLWWLPGTHRNGLPIFGPGATQDWAERTHRQRTANRGLPCRVFRGRTNSVYPIPA